MCMGGVFFMRARASESEVVLHGRVPLMSMNPKVLQLRIDIVVLFPCQTSHSSHNLDVQK